jgi:hypothetical protein
MRMHRRLKLWFQETCRMRLTACTAPTARCCPCGSQIGGSMFEVHATGIKLARRHQR